MPTPVAKTRKLKANSYRSFRMTKRVKHEKPQAIRAWKLFRKSFQVLKRRRRLFLGIVAVYLLLTVVLVKGFGVSTGVIDLKDTLQEVFKGSTGQLATGFTLFAALLTSTGSGGTETSSLYQTIFLVITSLALIWALRQVLAGEKPKVRDAFYRGMSPLVPFLLVLGVVCLQMTPLVIGTWLYSAVIASGVAATVAEQAVWWICVGMLTLLSFYMLTSSLFALYIVTLPEMTPMKALKSAREIVRYRRWVIMRKILALPVLLLLSGALIMVPLIIFATPVAEWAFFILNMAVLAVIHSYMYTLYRELL
jgi:hypothetical protein